MSVLLYLKRLIGNNPKASIGVGIFILILLLLSWRANAAEVDFRLGSSFATGTGPVIGLSVHEPIGDRLDWYASALLWGKTEEAESNWSWQTGVRTCRWSFCASLGASYLQRMDGVNDSHTNFNLELSWLVGWHRVSSIDLAHLSDAGTSPINRGRNAALVSIRLQ